MVFALFLTSKNGSVRRPNIDFLKGYNIKYESIRRTKLYSKLKGEYSHRISKFSTNLEIQSYKILSYESDGGKSGPKSGGGLFDP